MNTMKRITTICTLAAALTGCGTIKRDQTTRPHVGPVKAYALHDATPGCCPVTMDGGIHVRVDEQRPEQYVSKGPEDRQMYKIFGFDSEGRLQEYLQSKVFRLDNDDQLRIAQNWRVDQVPSVFDYLHGNTEQLPPMAEGTAYDAREDCDKAEQLVHDKLHPGSKRRETGN